MADTDGDKKIFVLYPVLTTKSVVADKPEPPMSAAPAAPDMGY